LLAVIRRLEARIAEQEKRIAELEAEVARLRKDSSTSSKPPSSDIVKSPKRPKPKGAKKRPKGAQPGHPKHERPPFSPDEVDEVWEYTLDACPDCGGALEPCAEPPRLVQQAELPAKLITVCEHRALPFWCPRCRRLQYPPLPTQVSNGGLAGPRLTAFVSYLKGACHCSYRTVQKLLQDALAFPVSTGYLAKLVHKASVAVKEPYEELLARLANEPVLNIDETGHKENGQRMWTWCFRARDFTLFRIDPSRGSEVLDRTLGAEFDGLLGCDYFSAYRKFMGQSNAVVQFCLAHLIRDVRFLTESRDKVTSNYGHRVLDSLRRLFRVIHRREQMVPARFQRCLEQERDRLLKLAKRAPPRTEPQNLAQRFRAHGKHYFTFITTPGIEPTNNSAEQAIRFCVLDRRVTQGTRAQTGRQWCERIWTLAATCAQRGQSLYRVLADTLDAHLNERPVPSL
jgi:transposase